MFRLLMSHETRVRKRMQKSGQQVTASASWQLIKSILIYASITVRTPINDGQLMSKIVNLLRLDPIGLKWRKMLSKPEGGELIVQSGSDAKKLEKALLDKEKNLAKGKEIIKFEHEEYGDLGRLDNLNKKSYIMIGSTYYSPVGDQETSKAARRFQAMD